MQNHKLVFFIIILISSMGQIMSDLYLPALPAIQQALHTNVRWVQWSISAYMIGFAVTPLIYGPLSDGIGRRKPLLFGMSLSLCGTLICIAAHNIEAFIIGRLLQGLGTGACSTLMRSVMRDLFQGETLIRYISYSSLIGVLILSAGPLLGSYLLYYYGWQSNFIFLAFYGAIALVSYLIYVPETNHHRRRANLRPHVIYKNIKKLFTCNTYLSYAVFSASAYGSIIAWLTVGPVLLQYEYHFTAIQVGYVTLLTGLSFGVGALLNSYFVKVVGCDEMIRIGFIGLLFSGTMMSLIAMTHMNNVTVLLALVVILFLSVPMIFPNSSIGGLAIFRRIVGNASAFYALIQVCGGFFSSTLLALAPEISIMPMALVIVVYSSTALYIHNRVIHKATTTTGATTDEITDERLSEAVMVNHQVNKQ